MRSARLPVKQLRAIQVGGVIELKIRVAQCLEFRAQRVRHHPLWTSREDVQLESNGNATSPHR